MASKDFNPNFFTDKLEQVIAALRQEVSHFTGSAALTKESREELDKYIYELNSFYYQSFNDRLFPLYKNSVQEEVTQLLQLSYQESMVKKDILANIKRYAYLYNQVKMVLSFFTSSRENASTSLLSVSQEQDHRAVELLYTLKRLEAEFRSLESLTDNIISWLDNREVMSLISSHPLAIPVLQLMSSLDKDDPRLANAMDRLLVYLAYLTKILSRIQPGQNKKQMAGIIEEIKKQSPQFSRIPVTPALTSFYELHIEATKGLYLNVLKLSLAGEQPELFNHTVRDFETWVTGLRILLEKAISSYTPVLSAMVNLNDRVISDIMKKLHDDSSNLVEAITSINNEFSSSSQPDFSYFSDKALEILKPAADLLKDAMAHKELTCFTELNILLNRLELDFSLLMARIDLLNRRQEHHSEVIKQFSSIIEVLDKYLNLLTNIRSDLERVLAPRNISRVWKEVTIKIEHIPLEKGQIFPLEYNYLLDKHLVETRLVPDEQTNNRILYEEGDIFIIRVDDLYEEVMPYLVIAQKG
jgi:hypothetical protein